MEAKSKMATAGIEMRTMFRCIQKNRHEFQSTTENTAKVFALWGFFCGVFFFSVNAVY